jgi:Spy/CpxP family protein refolding chaperone
MNNLEMKTANRHRWMVWAIVVLALLNISTLITVIYHNKEVVRMEAPSAQDSVRSENSSVLYSGRYFRDELNLTREQMNEFIRFNPEFRQQVRNINLELAAKKHEMLIEMAKEDSDSHNLDLLSDSIGYLHASLKKVTYKYYLNFKNICTPEQQKKLEQLFGEMFNSDTQMLLQNGSGGQRGKRFGWRNKN